MRKNRKIKGKRLIPLINKCMNKFTVTYNVFKGWLFVKKEEDYGQK